MISAAMRMLASLALRARRVSLAVRRGAAGGVVVVWAGVPGEGGRLLAPVASFQA